MILFLVNSENAQVRMTCEQLKQEFSLPVALIALDKLIKSGKFSIESIDNDLISIIDINNAHQVISSEIKLCYTAQYPVICPEWLPYTEEYDISYAQQEWWASLAAMFLSQKHIKFINPIWAKWDLSSELEQVLLLQKFDIPTVEMILTNNSQKANEYYNLWNQNVLYKTVRSGYTNSSLMQIPDLARLQKLHLSPVIFQKAESGTQISVCVLGNKFLTLSSINNQDNINWQASDIPENLKLKLIKVSEFLEIPWFFINFLHKEKTGEYLAFSMNIYPTFEIAYQTYGDTFVQALKNYLVEEYNK